MALMTKSQFAKHRDVSNFTVSKWRQQGLLKGVFRKKGPRLLILSATADRLMAERLDRPAPALATRQRA